MDIYSGYQICLPCMQCFFQNYLLWSCRMPYPSSCYSTQHCFWSSNSIYSKRSVAMVHTHGITDLTMFPSILKCLVWHSGGLAFWRLSYSSSWMTTFCRTGARFSRRLYILQLSTQYMMLLLLQPRLKGLGINKWKWEWHHSFLNLSDPLAKIYFLFVTLCSAGLEREECFYK